MRQPLLPANILVSCLPILALPGLKPSASAEQLGAHDNKEPDYIPAASTPNDVILCELGQTPGTIASCRKMILPHVARLSGMPELVTTAPMPAQDDETP